MISHRHPGAQACAHSMSQQGRGQIPGAWEREGSGALLPGRCVLCLQRDRVLLGKERGQEWRQVV